MLFKKKTKDSAAGKQKPSAINRHFIFIEVPVGIVAPEVILWGEAKWWPKDCKMRFTRLTEGEVRIGTQYRQKITQRFGPSWISEVTHLDPRKGIERTFKGGLMRGAEVVFVGERANGTRVDYELHYQVRGLINKILWTFFYRKQHDSNITKVLTALSEYVQKKYREHVPWEPEK